MSPAERLEAPLDSPLDSRHFDHAALEFVVGGEKGAEVADAPARPRVQLREDGGRLEAPAVGRPVGGVVRVDRRRELPIGLHAAPLVANRVLLDGEAVDPTGALGGVPLGARRLDRVHARRQLARRRRQPPPLG